MSEADEFVNHIRQFFHSSEIDELENDLHEAYDEIETLRAENEALKTVANFIIEYRSKNTRNFQLEKMDDFIRMLKELAQ